MPALWGVALAGALLLAGVATAQQGPGGGGGAPGGAGGPRGPVEVGVVTLAPESVPYVETLPGRAVAFQDAEIRPRVGGVIADIPYDPGQPVKAGDVLFVIGDETFSATLQAADASVAQAEAAVTAARAALDRARTLKGVGTTQAAVETAQVTLAQAEAALSSARAAQKLAQIDLEQTRVRSPIDGIASLPEVTIGAIVTANQATALARVQRIDPIYVDVQQASAAILRNRERLREGIIERADSLNVRLTLENGEVYEGTGQMVTPSLSVSTTTGTTQFRFRFDNPDRLILPGQFLRVQVTLGATHGLLVPQRATSRSGDGALTAFVERDGKARQVTLTEGGTTANSWIVTGGVSAGDRVIVDGLRGLRDGADVRPVPVTISADGVVEDAPSPAAGATPPTPRAAPGAQNMGGS